MVGTLDGNQTKVLRDMLNERVGNQSRMLPEFFGDIARSSGNPFVPDENGETLIGDGSQTRNQSLDVFSPNRRSGSHLRLYLQFENGKVVKPRS